MELQTAIHRRLKDLREPQRSSSESSRRMMPAEVRTRNCLTKYGDRQKFMDTFTPVMQVKFCRDADRCYFGEAPTLATIAAAYGRGTPYAWLVPQLVELSEFCGCKGKLTDFQLEYGAKIIADNFQYLKVTELMLFFYQLKGGLYGRFYGSIDIMVITTALQQFCQERRDNYARRERELQAREREKERENAITYEEYLKQKQHIKPNNNE